jgi:glycosyltransferase involved in cell wall biosynthesis
VGDGDDKLRLQTLTEQLGLSDAVIFAGYRNDLVTLLTRADLLLHTSLNEGVNLTAIRAMAAGLPIVGFQNSAPKRIISQGVNGLLVPLCDELALAQAIQQLSCDRSMMKRLGEEGRMGVKNYYNMADVVTFYEILYETIYKKKSLDALPDMSASMDCFNKHFSSIGRYTR